MRPAGLAARLLRWRLFRNFSALSGSLLIGGALRFLYLVVIARFLGPAETGIYVYGMAIYLALLGLALFGQGILLSTRLGRSRAEMSRVISHSFTVVAMMAAVAGTLCLMLVWSFEPEARQLQLGLLALTVVPRGLVLWVRDCTVALEDAAWIPGYELAFRGLEMVAGVTAILLGGGLLAVCAVHLSAWALEAMVALRRLGRTAGIRLSFGTNRRLLGRMVRISAYFMLSMWLLHLFSQVGILGVRWAQPDAAVVGYFGVAVQILAIFLVAPVTFGQAFLPSLSRDYRRGGPAPAALAFSIKALLVGGALVAVLADGYGQGAVTLLFGARFHQAGAVFASLCWALGPYAVAIVAVQALNGIGGRGLATTTAVVMVAGQAGLLALLQPAGVLPAAIAALGLGALGGCLLGVLFTHRRLGMAGHGWWLHPLIATAAAGAVMRCGLLPGVWAAPLALGALALLVWQLRIFDGNDLSLVRRRLQAVTG